MAASLLERLKTALAGRYRVDRELGAGGMATGLPRRRDGEPIIGDFGIAFAVNAAAGVNRLTDTGISLGTPHYMSPEQATGERAIWTHYIPLDLVARESLARLDRYLGPVKPAP